jgi:hypothetical protein
MKQVQLPKRFLNKYPEFKNTNNIKVLRYARNDFNEPIGVVVMDHNGYVGVSILNTHMGDKWDVVKGIRKALYRIDQKKTLQDRINEFYGVSIGHSSTYQINANYMFEALTAVSDSGTKNALKSFGSPSGCDSENNKKSGSYFKKVEGEQKHPTDEYFETIDHTAHSNLKYGI